MIATFLFDRDRLPNISIGGSPSGGLDGTVVVTHNLSVPGIIGVRFGGALSGNVSGLDITFTHAGIVLNHDVAPGIRVKGTQYLTPSTG